MHCEGGYCEHEGWNCLFQLLCSYLRQRRWWRFDEVDDIIAKMAHIWIPMNHLAKHNVMYRLFNLSAASWNRCWWMCNKRPQVQYINITSESLISRLLRGTSSNHMQNQTAPINHPLLHSDPIYPHSVSVTATSKSHKSSMSHLIFHATVHT